MSEPKTLGQVGYEAYAAELRRIGQPVLSWSEHNYKSAEEAQAEAIKAELIRRGIVIKPPEPKPDQSTICYQGKNLSAAEALNVLTESELENDRYCRQTLIDLVAALRESLCSKPPEPKPERTKGQRLYEDVYAKANPTGIGW